MNGAGAFIDHANIHSNDIGAILRHYGVEAARASIVREIAAVFGVYGISVDQRHLSLIADYMTSGGSYRPFNRQGMETATASPLLKMTFETTVVYLINSAVLGDWDKLTISSSKISHGITRSIRHWLDGNSGTNIIIEGCSIGMGNKCYTYHHRWMFAPCLSNGKCFSRPMRTI